ncbi:hypothetical protein P7C73_g607, partial [Tremellales sp. Uapishka_1]
MHSPNQGAEGIKNSADFRDTVRLLDYARTLAAQSYSNVHVLHLKYRFQGPAQNFRSPYTTGDWQLPINYRDPNGRLRNPVPQPFSVLHDPVIKLDYLETGIFDPLPAQAVFSHIAKVCQPPPRIIVVSYVQSIVTDNHLSSLASWGITSSPPCFVFSPLETRVREHRPLHLALNHAIPMSMYAFPSEGPPVSSPQSPSPPKNVLKEKAVMSSAQRKQEMKKRLDNVTYNKIDETPYFEPARSYPPSTTIARIDDVPHSYAQSNSQPEKRYPPQPVATLSVVTNGDPSNRPDDPSKNASAAPLDRIPLWALAPGVGILHGSTSVSIGVKLSDFSANKLDYAKSTSTNQASTSESLMRFPVDLGPIKRPSSTAPPSKAVPLSQIGEKNEKTPSIHLTPPERTYNLVPNTQSWPSPLNKVPGWRKGRRQQMDDVMDEIARPASPVDVLQSGIEAMELAVEAPDAEEEMTVLEAMMIG